MDGAHHDGPGTTVDPHLIRQPGAGRRVLDETQDMPPMIR